MKLKKVLNIGCLLVGGFMSVVAGAASLNISSEFRGDPMNPDKREFTNTTPVGGHCAQWPVYCPAGTTSISTPITISDRLFDGASLDKRKWSYMSMDSAEKNITLTNSITGVEVVFKFRLTLLSQYYRGVDGILFDSAGLYPGGGCAGTIGVNGGSWYAFGWIFPEGVMECWRKPTTTGSHFVSADTVSIGYQLVTPDPLRIDSGEYIGSVRYSVGNGQQIDLGEGNYSDNELVINIGATVHHDIKVGHIANGGKAQLQPPGGWGRWMQGGPQPQRLENDAKFILSGSGPFSVTLLCEHNNRNDCALKNADNGDLVPVMTGLTVPGVINAETNALIERIRLRNNGVPRLLYADSYLLNQRSTLHFQTGEAATQQMLSQPGSRWRGAVTLVFDAM